MTDKHLAPVIKTWLQGTDRPPPDSHRSTGQIMARLPERETHRRWWPFHRQTSSVNEAPTTDQTTEYQPTSIRSANGHSPTVLGRTQSMLSPVKVITAGAIIFALGGAVFVAQPFDREGGGVPGAESSEPVTVVVPGTDQWTDTGIDLKIDDTVSIEADGEITPRAADVPLHDPDGVPDGRGQSYNLEGLEEANHNSLIGRIGEDGAPFPVGSQLQSIADTDGRLFLGINDIDVANNAGEFTATVTVNP